MAYKPVTELATTPGAVGATNLDRLWDMAETVIGYLLVTGKALRSKDMIDPMPVSSDLEIKEREEVR